MFKAMWLSQSEIEDMEEAGYVIEVIWEDADEDGMLPCRIYGSTFAFNH